MAPLTPERAVFSTAFSNVSLRGAGGPGFRVRRDALPTAPPFCSFRLPLPHRPGPWQVWDQKGEGKRNNSLSLKAY